MPISLNEVLLVPREQFYHERITKNVPAGQAEFWTDSQGQKRLLLPTGPDTTRLIQESDTVEELVEKAKGFV